MDKNTERFSEHARTRAVQPPPLLYKYTTLETARLVIRTERIRFSSPLRFNDPFDGQWDPLWQLGAPEFNEAIAKRIVSSEFDLGGVQDDEIRAEFKRSRREFGLLSTEHEKQAYLERLAKSLDRGIVAEAREPHLLGRLRMLCFAAIPDSIQMWSYYGDHHKGVLLALHTADLERFWEIPAESVEYTETLPELVDTSRFVDYLLDAADEPESDHMRIAKALTLTKALGWSHEHEWRFASLAPRGDEREFEDVEFPITACAGIAAGFRTDMAAFDGLAAELLANHPDAQFWHLTRHARRFDLVAQRYKPEGIRNGT